MSKARKSVQPKSGQKKITELNHGDNAILTNAVHEKSGEIDALSEKKQRQKPAAEHDNENQPPVEDFADEHEGRDEHALHIAANGSVMEGDDSPLSYANAEWVEDSERPASGLLWNQVEEAPAFASITAGLVAAGIAVAVAANTGSDPVVAPSEPTPPEPEPPAEDPKAVALKALVTAAQDNSATADTTGLDVYTAAGVTGVTAATLAAINDVLNTATVNGAAVDTTTKVQRLVDTYNTIQTIAAGGTPDSALTISDLEQLGLAMADLSESHLPAVLAAIQAAIAAQPDDGSGTDSVTKLQTVIDLGIANYNAALNALSTAAQDNSATATTPGLDVYATAGVTGVTAQNLRMINEALNTERINGDKVNTTARAQSLVDAHYAIQAQASGAGPSPTQYADFGAVASNPGTLALLNDLVKTVGAAGIDTIAEITALARTVNTIQAIAAGETPDPALTIADLEQLGLITADLSESHLPAVLASILAAIAAQPDNGSGTDSVAKLQTVVGIGIGHYNAALNTLVTAAWANNATGPGLDVYATAGVTGVTAANLASINDALSTDAVNGVAVRTTAKVQQLVDTYNAILAYAEGSESGAGPSPDADQYALIGADIGAAATDAESLALLNDLVQTVGVSGVDTIAEINALARTANAIQAVAAGETPDPALTIATFQQFGLITENLSESYSPEALEQIWAAILEAIAAKSDSGHETDSVSKLQTLITDVIANHHEPMSELTSYVDNEGDLQDDASTSPATDDTTPGLNVGTGYSETVSLYINGVKVAATYDPIAGTLTPDVPVNGGSRSFTYTLTNATGNESAQSAPLNLQFPVAAASLSTLGSAQSGLVIIGEDNEGQSGYSVSAAGDVNGDGFADVIIGANRANDSAGKSYVVFGRSTGGPIELAAVAQGNGGFVITGESAGDQSGVAVSAAGDVNGDGLADLIIGATEVGSSEGKGYVVFGRSATTYIDLAAVAEGIGGFAITGGSGMTGVSVSAAGDVNGDGFADVIIGTQQSNSSYVVFGQSAMSNIDVADLASGIGGFKILGSQPASGHNVSSAGDVNGDGLADLIIGAPAYYSGLPKVYVAFGQSAGDPINLTNVAQGSGGFVITGGSYNDLTGGSVSGAGDVNGDGLADMIIGASLTNNYGGKSFVIFGQTATDAIDLTNLGDKGFVITGESDGDGSGSSVSAAGDVNGDGLADLIIGAPSANGGIGKSYVVFGRSAGGTIDLADVAQGNGGFVITGESDSNRIGYSVSAAGDVNGDGLADLIIGAPGPYYPLEGDRSYVIFGGLQHAVAVDALGTQGDDTLAGTTGADTLVGNDGADTLTGNAADVLLGGRGDDSFIIDANMVTALQAAMGAGGNTTQLARVDGGAGFDTLRLTDGASLDLTQVANQAASSPKGGSRMASIERIDLATDTGANTLTLNLTDVLDMTGMNQFNSSTPGWTGLDALVQRHQLVIDGTADDELVCADLANWTQASTASYNGQTYNIWNHNTSAAQLLVDADMNVV